MKRKKRSKKKSPTLTAEQEAEVRLLIQAHATEDPSLLAKKAAHPLVARAFIERLPLETPALPAILEAFGRVFEDKKVQKAIRKAAFRLKSRGLSVPAWDQTTEADDVPALKPVETMKTQSFLGPIDPSGSRGIFIAMPEGARGLTLGLGVVNDRQGFIEFHSGLFSRKKTREIREIFFQDLGGLEETVLSHAALILEEAYVASRESGRAIPSDYVSLRPKLLAAAGTPKRPPLVSLRASPSADAPPLTESALEKLFDHELMAGWVVDPEKYRPLLERMKEAEESPLLLSGAQQADRARTKREAWMEEHFSVSERRLLSRRLEETAWFLQKRGEEELAAIALQAADGLKNGDVPAPADPFLRFFTDRSIRFYRRADEAREPEAESPLLIL
ncbi:MAG: hypothetical protein JRJ18_02350 [Deltaproteobacteria bacterium]|nr:hypothetical protein [Deltaproteobacteria bacterium]MBW2006645.1 hypothetical protein [Deltaproteobacteria bacterium]